MLDACQGGGNVPCLAGPVVTVEVQYLHHGGGRHHKWPQGAQAASLDSIQDLPARCRLLCREGELPYVNGIVYLNGANVIH